MPERAQWIRTMFAEITRILNHLLNITTYALDCRRHHAGALGLRAARAPAGILRGGRRQPLPRRTTSAPAASRRTCRRGSRTTSAPGAAQFPKFLDELEGLLTENRIFKQRTVDIGVMTAEQAMAWGFSGPCLRASGCAWDLRKSQPYDDLRPSSTSTSPSGVHGDCYDRYLVRMQEMRQSLRIVEQCLAQMKPGPVKIAGQQDHRRRRAAR